MGCCGTTTLGTEADPIVLGDDNGAPARHVVFLSPVTAGAVFGADGWVTGSHVDPFLDAQYLQLAAGSPLLLAASAPADAPPPAEVVASAPPTDPDLED